MIIIHFEYEYILLNYNKNKLTMLETANKDKPIVILLFCDLKQNSAKQLEKLTVSINHATRRSFYRLPILQIFYIEIYYRYRN